MIFGRDNFLIPAMLLITLALTLLWSAGDYCCPMRRSSADMEAQFPHQHSGRHGDLHDVDSGGILKLQKMTAISKGDRSHFFVE